MVNERKRKSSRKFQKVSEKKMSHLEAIRSFVSLFMNKKERSQKYAGEFKPLRAICSRWQVKKSHQNFSDFQTFVIQYRLDKSSPLICCRCLRTKKKEVRRMPVNSSPLERFAQGGKSRNLIKIFQIFRLLSFIISSPKRW